MRLSALRVVLDTNILVRGLLNENSPSGIILRACERRILVCLLSRPLLAEYRAVLGNTGVVDQYPVLDDRRVKRVLERLTYVGEVVREVRVRFDLPRDPEDAKLIELCITGRATHLVTTDRDLLDLPRGHDGPARALRRRVPSLRIMKPDQFAMEFSVG